ncbi:MAG: hypothetical protein EP349_04520 [Alphaproteobacteria bacterium]|nr:MAG: hypothetical protein EP349_04520 [Alphaproteobacteria bacterium]
MKYPKAVKLIRFFFTELYHLFLFPNKWRYVVIFLTSMYIVSPVLGLFFPDVDTELKKSNLDRATVIQMLEINKSPIRVRPKNSLLTHLHTLTEKPFLFFYLYNTDRMNGTDGLVASWWWHHWRSYASPVIGCRITLTQNTAFDLGRFQLSDKQARKLLILHELRHCSEKNVLLRDPFIRETDADFQTIKAMEQLDDDPDFAQKFIYLRAMYICDEDYNNALYLDAAVHGREPPDFEEMRTANIAFHKKFRQNRVKDFDNMTELERRRAELFLESVAYQKAQMPETGRMPRVIASNRRCNITPEPVDE